MRAGSDDARVGVPPGTAPGYIPPMREETVFVGGPVFGHAGHPAVRVSGDRIVAIDRSGKPGLDGAEVVDLGGRMLVPGFGDAHVHPISAGLRMRRCDLSDTGGPDDAVELIRDHARTLRAPWLLGGGWVYDWFERGCPSRELLDRLVPDRPAFLVVRDGHSAWVNTRALELAGITASTPDPPDGVIERLEDGSPQGTLHEGAMALVDRIAPPPTESELDAALEAAQHRLFEYGVTFWQDAHVDADEHSAYLRAVDRGALRASVVGALWWERNRGLEQVEWLEQARREARGRYRPASVKLMLDGVIENFTASMLEHYEDKPGQRGIDFIDPTALREIVTELDRRGFQCHFHALGDRAVRSALDAVEAARLANGPSRRRHHLAHLQVVDPEDLPRFAALEVTANCQPVWACMEPAMTELTMPHIGERWRQQYPFAGIAARGGRLAMGSDWPVSTADVMEQISVAVHRLPPGNRDAEVLIAEQRLSLEQSLTAFTAGSAYVNHDEGRLGAVDVGMQADLVVLSQDPTKAPALEEIRVDLTLASGDVVFARA